MRCELGEYEWNAFKPMRSNAPANSVLEKISASAVNPARSQRARISLHMARPHVQAGFIVKTYSPNVVIVGTAAGRKQMYPKDKDPNNDQKNSFDFGSRSRAMPRKR